MPDKLYLGSREVRMGQMEQDRRRVRVLDGDAEYPLEPRHDLWNHSPDGFEWGYGGSGPAQLALAILADHLSSEPDGDKLASMYHQEFKLRVVTEFKDDTWTLTTEDVESAYKEIVSAETTHRPPEGGPSTDHG